MRVVNSIMELYKTTKAVALALGCSERTVFRWLSGQSTPSGDYVAKMYDLMIQNGDTLPKVIKRKR